MLLINGEEQDITSVYNNTLALPEDTGAMVLGRAVTGIIRVSPNGNSFDGSSWDKAFQTFPEAFAAASTNVNDLTLILVAPHETYYDMDTMGDPTYSGNYIIKGSHRNWAKIQNTHLLATSIMKFTGLISLIDLNFNLGTETNGVILTHGGARGCCLQFVGESLTISKTALELVGDTNLKHARFADVHLLGHKSYMTGLKLDKCSLGLFERFRVHECLKGAHIVDVISDSNMFHFWDIGDCSGGSGIAFDLDAGNEQHFDTILLHHNDTNFDDEVGDHHYRNIDGHFSITTEPDNFTGVAIATGDGANVWTASETTVRAAAACPFRIIGIQAEADVSEKFRLRLKINGISDYFADIQFEGNVNVNKREALNFPQGTEFIFNKGNVIEGSAKSESAGVDNVVVWLEIQEI